MDLDQKSKGWGSQVSRTRPVRWSWNESCTPEAKRNSKHESINQNDPTLFNSKINILQITIVYRKAARVSFQHEIPAHPISRLPTTPRRRAVLSVPVSLEAFLCSLSLLHCCRWRFHFFVLFSSTSCSVPWACLSLLPDTAPVLLHTCS